MGRMMMPWLGKDREEEEEEKRRRWRSAGSNLGLRDEKKKACLLLGLVRMGATPCGSVLNEAGDALRMRMNTERRKRTRMRTSTRTMVRMMMRMGMRMMRP
jgi:hypothetical protein